MGMSTHQICNILSWETPKYDIWGHLEPNNHFLWIWALLTVKMGSFAPPNIQILQIWVILTHKMGLFLTLQICKFGSWKTTKWPLGSFWAKQYIFEHFGIFNTQNGQFWPPKYPNFGHGTPKVGISYSPNVQMLVTGVLQMTFGSICSHKYRHKCPSNFSWLRIIYMPTARYQGIVSSEFGWDWKIIFHYSNSIFFTCDFKLQ